MPTKEKDTGIVITNKKDKPFKGARLSRPMKARKMLAPQCEIHFPGDGTVSPYSGWWKDCKAEGHNPYVTVTTIEKKTPKLEKTEDGRTLVVGETVELEYIETPNWSQVPDELGFNSGRAVHGRLARGYIFPEDLGYAPFCDYLGCGEQNPKFQTRFGNYHRRDEAAIMAIRLDFGSNNETESIFTELDATARNRQLREKAAEEGIA